MVLGHIQRSKDARVFRQVLHLAGAPDRIQSHLLLVPIDCTQAPQRIVQPVAFEDRGERQRLVVGLCFAEVTQQFGPAI
jgi:hypothetical protein